MYRPLLGILCAGVLMMSYGIMNAARANLFSDGDFEACTDEPGEPINSTCGDWSFASAAAVNDGIGVGGSKGVRVESGGSFSTDPTAIQSVGGLVVGDTYQLSWDLDLRVNASGNPASPSFGVFLDDQLFANALFLLPLPADGYVEYTTDFVATQTTHTFIFAGELDSRTNGAPSATDVSYNLDNVSLERLQQSEVPEPGSMILFGIGLAGLGVFRARQRQGRRAIVK